MAITRQTIVNNLKTLLQTITIAGGYYSNLGNNIKLFSVLPIEEDELPCAIIFDKLNNIEDEVAGGAYNYWMHNLQLNLKILCSGNTPDTTVRQIIADVYKAINTDNTLGGNCIMIEAVNDSIEIEQQSLKISGADINLICKYRTKRFLESI